MEWRSAIFIQCALLCTACYCNSAPSKGKYKTDTLGITYKHSSGGRWIQPTARISVDGDVVNVMKRSSPTFVIRAIKAQLGKLGAKMVTVLTVKKLHVIAQLWIEELLPWISGAQIKILDMNKTILYKQFLKVDHDFDPLGQYATLLLLDPAALSENTTTDFLTKPWILTENLFEAYRKLPPIQYNEAAYTLPTVFFVGNCMPIAMRFSSDIKSNVSFVTAPVQHWMNGTVPFQNISFHTIQRKHGATYLAVPYRRVFPDGSVAFIVKPHRYYGYLMDTDIFVSYNERQLGITSCKNGVITGLGGDFIKSLQGFLKFRIYCKRHYGHRGYRVPIPEDGIRVINYNYSPINFIAHIQVPDIYLSTYPPYSYFNTYHTYPYILMDYASYLVRYHYEEISFNDLFSLMSFHIWMCITLSLMAANCCFFLIYCKSPELQRNIKVRNKVVSKAIGCFTLHWLVLFRDEWERCPAVSVKWILVTYNIFFLLMSSIYIPIYTKKIFSLKRLMPVNLDDLLIDGTVGFSCTEEFMFYLLWDFCHNKACKISERFFFTPYRLTYLLGKLMNGNVTMVIGLASNSLTTLKDWPEIGFTMKYRRNYPFSFISDADFEFVEIFHSIMLKMRETGATSRLRKYHIDFDMARDSVLNPVSFSLVWYLLAILGVGNAVAIIACFIEKLIWKQRLPSN